MTSLKCFRRDGQPQFRRGVIGGARLMVLDDGDSERTTIDVAAWWCLGSNQRHAHSRNEHLRHGPLTRLNCIYYYDFNVCDLNDCDDSSRYIRSHVGIDFVFVHLLLRRRRSRTTTTTTRWSSSGPSDCRFGVTLQDSVSCTATAHDSSRVAAFNLPYRPRPATRRGAPGDNGYSIVVIRRVAAKGWNSNCSGTTAAIWSHRTPCDEPICHGARAHGGVPFALPPGA